tara:strand:+ start:268 stop:819 length:552 start_codon:yes stop_codon:yes gene_type:complete
MNIEDYKIIGTENKTWVNPYRGAPTKVEMHEHIYSWGDDGFLLVRTQNLTSRTFNLRTMDRKRYDEISMDVCYRINPNFTGYMGRFFVKFKEVGNDTNERLPDGFGISPWSRVKSHKSFKKALGELRKVLLAEDYRSYDNYVILTKYSDDLVYPETASEEYKGKPHPIRSTFSNWVCYENPVS